MRVVDRTIVENSARALSQIRVLSKGLGFGDWVWIVTASKALGRSRQDAQSVPFSKMCPRSRVDICPLRLKFWNPAWVFLNN